MNVRKAKRILASVLAVGCIMSFSPSAFAEETNIAAEYKPLYEFYIKEDGYEGVVTFDSREDVYAYFGLNEDGSYPRDWYHWWWYDDDYYDYGFYNQRGYYRDRKHYNGYWWDDDDYGYGYGKGDFDKYLKKFYQGNFEMYLADNYDGKVKDFIKQYYRGNFANFLNDYLDNVFGTFFATNQLDTINTFVMDYFSNWFSFFGFGFGHGRVYSDGHASAHYTRTHYKDHLHYGLETGKGRYIADGNWYGDPTVAPDGVRPHAPGHREHVIEDTKVLEKVHAFTASIDTTMKSVAKIFENIFKTEDKSLVAAKEADLQHADQVMKENVLDLSKNKTMLNPDKAQKYMIDAVSEKPLTNAEIRLRDEEHPIFKPLTGEDLLDPEKVSESRKKSAEYMENVRKEASTIYMAYNTQIKALTDEIVKLHDSMNKAGDKDNLAYQQKAAKVKSLSQQIDYLKERYKSVKQREEDLEKKYENKLKDEAKSRQSVFMSYQAYDPYNKDKDEDAPKTSSKNFGIMSFNPSKYKE